MEWSGVEKTTFFLHGGLEEMGANEMKQEKDGITNIKIQGEVKGKNKNGGQGVTFRAYLVHLGQNGVK